MAHKVQFLSRNRMAECSPNPLYPNGIELDTGERPACKVELPYPAECVGVWFVSCDICKTTVAVTAAGRIDDPKSVMVKCQTRR